jgi:hypothetical protein
MVNFGMKWGTIRAIAKNRITVRQRHYRVAGRKGTRMRTERDNDLTLPSPRPTASIRKDRLDKLLQREEKLNLSSPEYLQWKPNKRTMSVSAKCQQIGQV